MKRNQGVPQIDSEIQVALALLQWTPRQFSEYADSIGYRVPLGAMEEALSMPLSRFSASAKPGVVENIAQAFASLGLGFSSRVFGVVIHGKTVRVPTVDSCLPISVVIGHLLKCVPKAVVTIAIQCVGQAPRSPAILMELPFGTHLLFDALETTDADHEEILAVAYATDLMRVRVATSCIEQTAAMLPAKAASTILAAELKPAANVPRSRMIDLLRGAEE